MKYKKHQVLKLKQKVVTFVDHFSYILEALAKHITSQEKK